VTSDYDVVVIGSGAGGSTLAAACAAAGRSTLLIERGPTLAPAGAAHGEHAMLVAKQPYDARSVAVNDRPRRLYMGGVVGGGTALYGAALVRPSAGDFHPGRHYGRRLPRAVWDWPIGYETLEPYYTSAERLFEVAGPSGDDFGPLGRPVAGYLREPPPLKPINARLATAGRALGLHPFRLPLAIDFSRCLDCPACPGHLCPTGARRSSAQVVAERAAAGAPLRVLTGTTVERLERTWMGEVTGVRARSLDTGRETVFRAKRYVLAAGAIGSPAILLRSELGGPLVGRNYMMHLSPIAAGVFPRRIGADAAFVKQLGFADYYFGSATFRHKLGLVQSLPVPGPLMLAKASPVRLPARLLSFLRARLLPLVGIVEDLPHPDNRVTLGPDGGIRLRHAFSRYDLIRGRHLLRLMRRILKRAGAVFCLGANFPSAEHVAHQCGTLRFGTDPRHAVADADCRVFGVPNLFIADGSVLPTSLGVGPALTIIANALRVADVVIAEC
jgi:choline dehydrogenase-like flavoprotein